jgi:hypothetical protein
MRVNKTIYATYKNWYINLFVDNFDIDYISKINNAI